MKKRAILVVDGEGSSVVTLKAFLETSEEFYIDVASTGYDALRHIGASVPHALLLSTTLRDLSASEVCRVIRSRERTAFMPIIVLGERADSHGVIDALENGADDYMVKPLNEREVAARLKAILRRRVDTSDLPRDRFRGVHLSADFTNVAVAVDDRAVRLTKREFLLLRCLVHNRNRVVGRDRLLAGVWPPARGLDCRVVDSAIYKLRSKLCTAGRQIETVPGFGYRFAEPPEVSEPMEGRTS